MRLHLLNDTSGAANWGCRATSAGLRRRIAEAHPAALTRFAAAETLWPKDRKLLRPLRDRLLRDALLGADGPKPLARALDAYGFDRSLLDGDLIVFNGEGMIHDRSAYVVRLAAAMALAKRLGRSVAVTNQTVDLRPDGEKAAVVAAAYAPLDRVETRDAESAAALRALGVTQARLVPDAAFVAPWPEPPVDLSGFQLPERFVAVTASSALTRKDTARFEALCSAAEAAFGAPAIALASAKTDKRLAARLGLRAMDDRASLDQAMAAIARAEALIGGRYHPMILAARAGTPIVGLDGNTFKSRGLLSLLEYPAPALGWDETEALRATAMRVAAERDALSRLLKQSAADLADRVIAAGPFGGDGP